MKTEDKKMIQLWNCRGHGDLSTFVFFAHMGVLYLIDSFEVHTTQV